MTPPPEIRVMPNAARILGGDSTGRRAQLDSENGDSGVNNLHLDSENGDSGARGAHVDSENDDSVVNNEQLNSETKPKRVVGRLSPNRTQATTLLPRGSMAEMRDG